MADLYDKSDTNSWVNRASGGATFSGNPDVDSYINSLPDEEKQNAIQQLNAPLTGEEVSQAMMKNENFTPTMDEYRAYKEYTKTKDTDILDAIGTAAGQVAEDFGNMFESLADKPEDIAKLPSSVVEAFAQGTRNLYGMIAQSQDPDSLLFKWKDALSNEYSDEGYRQFLDARDFNRQSIALATGKETLFVDKNHINHEFTQVASYIADPTLFIPFGGIASEAAKLVGMGERLAAVGARAGVIKNAMYAGALKYGVGVPLEAIGGATRTVIDKSLEKSAMAFEFASGIEAKEATNYVKRFGFGTGVADLGGYGVPIASEISQAYVGAGIAKGFGEAVNAAVAQAQKQGYKRGGLSFARAALEEANQAALKGVGTPLSKHAQNLLKVLDKADPMLMYAKTGMEGAAHGALIGAGLGYLGGGEEGMAHGIGAGMMLGAIGGIGGKGLSDIVGATHSMMYETQANMALAIMKEKNPANHDHWQLLKARFPDQGDLINKMIVAVDVALPNVDWKMINKRILSETLIARGLDPLQFDGFEHEVNPTFEPKPEKPTAIAEQRNTAEWRASWLARNKGLLPDNVIAEIKAGKFDTYRKFLESIGLKGLSDAEVVDAANRTLQIETEHKASNSSEDYQDKHTKLDGIDSEVANLEQLKPENRGKEIKELERIAKEGNSPFYGEKEHAEVVRRAQAEGLINSKGTGEAEAGGVRHKLDGNGNKIRVRDEHGFDMPTLEEIDRASGWINKKGADGRTKIYVNLDYINNDVSLHEFGHGVFSELALKPEFKQRLRTYVLGQVDENGKIVIPPVIDLASAKTFFGRYIEIAHSVEDSLDKKLLLNKALEEYYQGGKMNVMDLETQHPFLDSLVEEFGTYYWTQFIKGKPVDYLFKGGEMSIARTVMETVKNGYIDMMKSEIERVNPQFRFNEEATGLNDAFIDKNGNRVRIKELDALMTDMVKSVMQTNRNGSFDFGSLSTAGQEAYIKANGMERVFKKGLNGKYKMMGDKELELANRARGVEIYKALDALDPKLKLVRDENGNVIGGLTKVNDVYTGMMSNEVLDHLVATGHMSQPEASKLRLLQDVVLKKTKANIITGTYFGKSAQTTTGAVDIRVYGDKVPIKDRKMLVLGIDNTFKRNGDYSSKLSVLDWQNIETRGKNLWDDPVVRQLWGNDKTSFEGDFFRYLENASKPLTDNTRLNDFSKLWSSDGEMKRNIMHQFAGLGKEAAVPYANNPITTIHWDINQAFTYFLADRLTNVKLGKEFVKYDHKNAGHDISRNMMPNEMKREKTPAGEIYSHESGFRFIKTDKDVTVFDANGDVVGSYKTMDEAVSNAVKAYNKAYPEQKPINSFENLKSEVVKPKFESKEAYIIKRLSSEVGKLEGMDEVIGSVKIARDGALTDLEHYRKNPSQTSRMKYYEDTYNNLKDLHEYLKTGKTKLSYWELVKTMDDHVGSREAAVLKRTVKDVLSPEWDAKYPMKFSSALMDSVSSLFEKYPDITAHTLLKKLLRIGSSEGLKLWSEADYIGLIDLLKKKAKVKETTYSIMRTTDPNTGKLYPRGTPDAPVIRMPSGEKDIPLDKAEILKYIDDNKIVVTVEQNAREVGGMDTQRLTAVGTRTGYMETAIRVNEPYRSQVTGHYGEAAVHHRTTDRADIQGKEVTYVDEIQATNEDRNDKVAELKKDSEKARKENDIIEKEKLLPRLQAAESSLITELVKAKDKYITIDDIGSIIHQLLTLNGRDDERNLAHAIDMAALNVTENGINLTPFHQDKVINLAKSINNIIDAWADSASYLFERVNKNDYKEYLKEAEAEGTFELSKLKAYVEFVRKEFKIDTSKPLLDIIVDLATHSQATMYLHEFEARGLREVYRNQDGSVALRYQSANRVHEKMLHALRRRDGVVETFFSENKLNLLNESMSKRKLVGVRFDPITMMHYVSEYAGFNPEKMSPIESAIKFGFEPPEYARFDYDFLETPNNYFSRLMCFGNLFYSMKGGLRFERLVDMSESFGIPALEVDTKGDFRQIFNHLEPRKILKSANELNSVKLDTIHALKDTMSRGYGEGYSYINEIHHTALSERFTDNKSVLDKLSALENEGDSLPYIGVQEWGLLAIKSIIAQSIQNGRDKITLTHPDDAPTKSHMPEGRYDLYGRILPEITRSFVKQWGIEVKQDLQMVNKIRDDALKVYADATTVASGKMSEMKTYLKSFKGSESPEVVKGLFDELGKPIQELVKTHTVFERSANGEVTPREQFSLEKSVNYDMDIWAGSVFKNIKNLKDKTLRFHMLEILEARKNEWKGYAEYTEATELAKQGTELALRTPDADTQSHLAIDRGTSFILNDKIKEAFTSGDEKTALRNMMPREKGDKAVRRVVNKFEYDRMMAIVNAKGNEHIKAAVDRGDITFDSFQHSKYRNYHVVAHGLDNAPTTDWVDADTGEIVHRGQGGGTYPAYRPSQVWATTKADMADVINRVGELNKAEHGEWIAPVMFIKSPDTKTRGTPNGANGYINAMSLLNRKGAIDEQKFKQGLVKAFSDSGKPIGDESVPLAELLDNAKAVISDKKYAMKSRAALIEKLNSSMSRAIDFKNPAVESLIPTLKEFKGERPRVDQLLESVYGMMSDPLFSHAKSGQSYGGDAYGMLMIDSPVEAIKGDFHDSYQYSLVKKDGSRVKVDYLTTPVPVTKLIKSSISKIKTIKGDKSKLALDEYGTPSYKETNLREDITINGKQPNKSSIMLNSAQTQRPAIEMRLKMPAEFKDSAKRLMDAIDAQSSADNVPSGIKAGVGMLIQAIEKQHQQDIKGIPAGVKKGLAALRDAVDRQADEDKIPAKIKAGVEKLIKMSEQFEPKPEPQPAQQTAQPESQPTFNTNPQYTSTRWRSFVQEPTGEGTSIYRNAMDFVIVQANGKFKVYNPYKSMLGIYTNLEQAKLRVQREEPKAR